MKITKAKRGALKRGATTTASKWRHSSTKHTDIASGLYPRPSKHLRSPNLDGSPPRAVNKIAGMMRPRGKR